MANFQFDKKVNAKAFSIIKVISIKAALAITVVAATPIVTTVAYAAGESNKAAAKNLNQQIAGVKSMTANFSQTTQAGGKKSNFSGKMSVQRQNKFRWEIRSPSEQLIVADGNTMWIYDKDLQQATHQSIANQVGETPALLLSGDPNQIAKHFNISQPDAFKNYFVLTPKSGNNNFKNLSLSFNGGKPVMMVLNDALGQTTTLQFSNISLNQKISEAQFNFTPPKGVDIINQ